MRLRRLIVLVAVLAVAAVACDRVVDLTPDAHGPDAGNPLPDARTGLDAGVDAAPLPDAAVLD